MTTVATVVAPAEASPPAPCTFGTSFTLGNPNTPDGVRVGQMRKITRAHLRMWNVPEPLAEDIVLAVSELITNAVEYGDSDGRAVGLQVLYANARLRVEVADGNPSPAALRSAADDEESGRGLFLVEAFATGWGVSEDGETTWCEFNIPAGRP